MTQNPSYVADGDIGSSRFVVQQTTKDHRILVAGAAAKTVGVSHEGSREAPIPGITPLAAKAGESCRVYGEDETCDVVAAAAITPGDYLASDAAGAAVVATTGQFYGARALAAAASGELARVQVVSGQLN